MKSMLPVHAWAWERFWQVKMDKNPPNRGGETFLPKANSEQKLGRGVHEKSLYYWSKGTRCHLLPASRIIFRLKAYYHLNLHSIYFCAYFHLPCAQHLCCFYHYIWVRYYVSSFTEHNDITLIDEPITPVSITCLF